jgi:L-amino acid N-acyltransferase
LVFLFLGFGVFNGSMQVRPATREDLPAIVEIYNDAVLNTTASYDYEPHSMEQRVAWFEAHQQNRQPVFVAVENSTVLGWSSLSSFRERIGYRFTVENSVYVAAAHRRRGVGAALIPPLIESAQVLGMRAIIAAIDAQNETSIRLHARFGFMTVGHFKQVGFKFGRWLDVVYMERLLNSEESR